MSAQRIVQFTKVKDQNKQQLLYKINKDNEKRNCQ